MTDHQTGPNSLATAALFFGFLSLLSSFTGIGGVSFGALSIILALLSKTSAKMRTNAKVAMGLSIAGMLVGTILMLVAISHMESAIAQMLQTYDSGSYTFELPSEDSENTETPQYSIPYNRSPYQNPYSSSSGDVIDL